MASRRFPSSADAFRDRIALLKALFEISCVDHDEVLAYNRGMDDALEAFEQFLDEAKKEITNGVHRT